MGQILQFARPPTVDEAWTARMARVLIQIESPGARKIVIMAKRERWEITDEQTEALIHRCGLVAE